VKERAFNWVATVRVVLCRLAGAAIAVAIICGSASAWTVTLFALILRELRQLDTSS
jgi:hypothetical protein